MMNNERTSIFKYFQTVFLKSKKKNLDIFVA